MNKKPKVSVLCLTYNQEKFINQMLDSILMQKTDFDFEIIINDDHSTDDTQKILKQYQKKYPFIKLILQPENLYSQGKRNFIARFLLPEATGQYIALLEGDDYWTDPDKLQKQVDFMDAHPSYALCFHSVKVIFENGEEDASIWPVNIVPERLTVANLIKENYVPTNAVMYRRQVYKNVALDVMPVDWYLHLYHAQFGKIGYLTDVMSVYRRHKDGLWWNSFKNPDQHMQNVGLKMLALLKAVEDIYGHDESLKRQIEETAAPILIKLMNLKIDDQPNFAEEVVSQNSQLATNVLKLQDSELQDMKQSFQEANQKVAELETEVQNLKGDNFKLKADVQGLRGSRMVGKIIKVREKAGSLKQDAPNLPLKAVIKTKRAISKLAPESAKPVVRHYLLRPARKVLRIYYSAKDRRNSIYSKNIKYIANERWADGPLVSIVVPYFNRSDIIDETIESIYNQTLKDYEVILVNDGSTEAETPAKLAELQKKHPQIKIVNQTNQGVAATRNNGIKLAKGKYIVCLDSDDMIDPTYIEKCSILLELNQDISIITTYRQDFGVLGDEFRVHQYEPRELFHNNMVITAAQFRKIAWQKSGGYKSNIGYEDWEFWLNLAENGFFGKLLPEVLFYYRVAMASRFVSDRETHWKNIKAIQAMHKGYLKKIKLALKARRPNRLISTPETAFVNLNQSANYVQAAKKKPKVLITVPWMTFGGAETLIYNFCREIKANFDISFITGLQSEHEWEYKFREISTKIYHLPNLFEDPRMYQEFILNYIETRDIQILHIIHNGFMFQHLEAIKAKFPNIKIIVTMFNDRVDYFETSIGYQKYIDAFTSDNNKVINNYKSKLTGDSQTMVIPNGIDCYSTFRLDLFDKQTIRDELGIGKDDLSVFFVGRLSEEKNPDVFVAAAAEILKTKKQKNVKFFVIGDGGMRPDIEAAIKEINHDNIKYLGYQSEVAKYLSAADIFVLPSSIEGFPLSILEAMAMKVAVIASDVGAIAEVIQSGKEGFVVTPGSKDEIVERITELSKNPELLASVKVAARKKVELMYSNIALGENYTKLYKEYS